MAEAGSPFRISLLPRARADLAAMREAASRLGIAARVRSELLAIEQRLRTDPSTWGDPLNRIRSMNLVVYRAIAAGISIQYAVHQEQPVVFVQSFTPVLNPPLATGGS